MSSLSQSSPAYPYHRLGESLVRKGQIADAAKQFRKAIEIDNTFAPSLLALGQLMLENGNPMGAIDCGLLAKPFDPEAGAFILQVLDSCSAHDAVKAKGWLNEAGQKCQVAGEFALAAAAFTASIQANPAQGVAYWGIEQSLPPRSDRPYELPHLIQLLEENTLPPREQAYLAYTIAKTHADARRYAEAMETYDVANRNAAIDQFGTKTFDRDAYRASFDRTIELFDRSFLSANRGRGDSSEKPIFIIGMMRSGTTLLEQILSSHPEVAGAGELMFWLERGPKVVDPRSRKVDPVRSRTLVSDFLQLLSRVSAKPRVIDKMPENVQLLGLIHLLLPNARVVHARRHPVDTCLSIYTTPYEVSAGFAHNRENIVFAYQQHERLMTHWREVLPANSFLDVSYEDLVETPEQTVRSVLEYCGLPWNDQCLAHQENPRRVETPSLWQARQPLYKTSSGKWLNYRNSLGPFQELLNEPER